MRDFIRWGLGSLLLSASVASAGPVSVTVKIENLAPQGGTFLTPLWVAFHDGNFDSFSAGSPISAGLERLVEDGSTNLSDSPRPSISELFRAGASATAGGIDDALPNNVGVGRPGFAVLAPGASFTKTFTLDSMDPAQRYFSYASMVIPSNDFFIANDDPKSHALFDSAGKFLGADFTVRGNQVLDAGSEVNDEIPMNTAFLGQMGEDIGVAENGVVTFPTGFKPKGSGGILDTAMFANADFTASGYQVARITVTSGATAVPLPPAAWTGLAMLAGLGMVQATRIRRRQPA